MIRTVTLNTGFDALIEARREHREHRQQVVPSGKGVNCARTLRALSTDVVVYGLIGVRQRDRFASDLADEGIASCLETVEAVTRTNITLLEDGGGEARHYRAAGFTLADATAVERLCARLEHDIVPGDLVSLHGSLPTGVPDDTWRQCAAAAHARGARVSLDTYGAPLQHALSRDPDASSGVQAGTRYEACTPNADEALGLAPTLSEALHVMQQAGVAWPIVTDGSHGALCLDGDSLMRGQLPLATVRLTVGAGDAFLAGLLAAMARGERSLTEAFRLAIATAAAHVEGTPVDELRHRAEALLARVSLGAEPDVGDERQVIRRHQ